MAKERQEETAKLQLRDYFFERPLALSVIHLLSTKKDGMTATELSDELHLSVPTLYRLTLEMHGLGLLQSERFGRKNVFMISKSIENQLPSTYEYVRRILESRTKHDRFASTRELVKEYDLSLSPKVAQSMVVSALRRKITESLPSGIRPRSIGDIRTVLDEPVKFDFYIGSDTKAVAIELKIIETIRNLRERLGTLAILAARDSSAIAGIVAGYLIAPLGGKWLVDDITVDKAINSLNPSVIKLVPVVSKVTKFQILDNVFLEAFAKRIVKVSLEVMRN